jgi:hypothetical protein
MKNIFFSISLLFFSLWLTYGQSEKLYGTGFFVSDNGLIITCAHIMEGKVRPVVKIADIEYPVQILTKDIKTDLAVLKINYKNPHHFKISNFNPVSLGDKVYVLGFPLSDILGSDIRLTDGIVSAKSGINSNQLYFQISAPIQPGNSGGPIINDNFEVIGITAAKLGDMATLAASGVIPQNVNFGIKSNYINPLLNGNKPGNGTIKTMNDAIKATVQILCYETKEQSGPLIEIVNKTGYIIFSVYISPVSSSDWGDDLLEDDILLDGQSVKIKLQTSLNTVNRYDILLEDSDGDTYTKANVLITPNKKIEFTIKDIDD